MNDAERQDAIAKANKALALAKQLNSPQVPEIEAAIADFKAGRRDSLKIGVLEHVRIDKQDGEWIPGGKIVETVERVSYSEF